MSVPEDYYGDGAKKARARRLLLARPETAGVVPPENLKVLAKVMGVHRYSNLHSSVSRRQRNTQFWEEK